MKQTFVKYIALTVAVLFTASCATTYDAAGNPVQSVTPGGAAAIAAGAGVAGYAIGRNNTKTKYVPVAPRRRGWR